MNKLSINSIWSETVFVLDLHDHSQPDLSSLVKNPEAFIILEVLK